MREPENTGAALERWAQWVAFFLALGLTSFWLTSRAARAEEDSSDTQTSPSARESTHGRRQEPPPPAQSSSQSSSSDFTLRGWERFGVNYFLIFYGPSIGQPSSFQPRPNGEPDRGRPVVLKNFLTLSYAMSRDVGISGTAYWHYQPVMGQDFMMRDPYFRVSHDRLVEGAGFSLYADVRVHFGVTELSRDNDMLTGIQTFQMLTYDVSGTPLQLGVFGSARLNIYGSQGFGPDVELYLGPNLSYRLSPTFEITVLYEMGMSHFYGDPPGRFYNDGTDLEPGFRWQITPNLMINPYLNLFTGDRINLDSTSLGMMLNWNLY